MNNNYEQLSLFTQLNTTNYTYKSFNLIMSSYNLSLIEHRIITLGCKKIKPIYVEKRIAPKDLQDITTAMNFTDIEISVSEYKKEFKTKGNGIYDALEKYCDLLFERKIQYIDELNRPSKKRWIEDCTFDRPNGKIILTFNIKMIPDLLILKGRYVPLFLGLLSENIKSKHTFRTYEILKSNLYNKTWKVSVEEYKYLLGIKDKYSKYGELNRNVISPSLKSINKFSDIFVNLETIKSGKSIKWLVFNISSNNSTKSLHENNNEFKNTIPTVFEEISNSLKKLNVELSSEDAEILIDEAIEVTQNKYKDKNVVEYILEKIDVLGNYLLNNKVDNVIGYLLQAIKKDWKVITINNNKGFNNFDGRQYTDIDYINIENKLLGWD